MIKPRFEIMMYFIVVPPCDLLTASVKSLVVSSGYGLEQLVYHNGESFHMFSNCFYINRLLSHCGPSLPAVPRRIPTEV